MSGDYTYDDEAVSLSDSDRGSNNASGLEGYGGDIRLGEWVGLKRNPHELRARPEEMREVVKKLRELADTIREAGSVREVQRASDHVQLGPSAWQGAAYLQAAAQQTARVVSQKARLVADNLDQAASAIESAAQGYDNADTSNESGFAR